VIPACHQCDQGFHSSTAMRFRLRAVRGSAHRRRTSRAAVLEASARSQKRLTARPRHSTFIDAVQFLRAPANGKTQPTQHRQGTALARYPAGYHALQHRREIPRRSGARSACSAQARERRDRGARRRTNIYAVPEAYHAPARRRGRGIWHRAKASAGLAELDTS